MSFRGGRGRGSFGRGGFGGGLRAKELPFEPFPEIQDLGTAKYNPAHIQLIKWSTNLQKFCISAPYYYEDKSQRLEKLDKPDLERYSDRKLIASKVKQPLSHFIKMDPDHMVAELARGDKRGNRAAIKIDWNPESDMSKLDRFETEEDKLLGKEKTGKKDDEAEEEEEEEEGEKEEDEGEFSDEGDYEQAEDFDDDEDDYNMDPDTNDEPFY